MVVGFDPVTASQTFLIATPILKTRCPSLGATRPVFGREVTATLHAKGFGFHAGDNAVGGGGGDGGGGVAHGGSIPDPATPVKGSGTDFYF